MKEGGILQVSEWTKTNKKIQLWIDHCGLEPDSPVEIYKAQGNRGEF